MKTNTGKPRTVHEAREEIARTRARIDGETDIFLRRLGPQGFMNEAMRHVGATANSQEETMHHDLNEIGKNIGDCVRSNPIPAALAAIGLGWLFFSHHDSAKKEQAPRMRRRAHAGVDESRDRIRRSVDEAGERIHDAIDDAGHWVDEQAHAARDQVRHASEQARHYADEAAEATRREVREHPLRSGLAAFAVGALVGLTLGHRK
jgi:ElaB/YqjD/DUF883 family membrane-anchored ribosome-binding protein